MNKSQLFLNAWSIARNASAMFGGSVKSYFAESLKLAYVQNVTVSTEDKLIALGMKVWVGGNNRRIYINAEHYEAVFGLWVNQYKGRITNATLNGKELSNRQATAMHTELRGVYFNCNTQKFASNSNGFSVDAII